MAALQVTVAVPTFPVESVMDAEPPLAKAPTDAEHDAEPDHETVRDEHVPGAALGLYVPAFSSIGFSFVREKVDPGLTATGAATSKDGKRSINAATRIFLKFITRPQLKVAAYFISEILLQVIKRLAARHKKTAYRNIGGSCPRAR